MEWIIPIWTVAILAALAASAYALHLAIQTRIEIQALQKSTHAVHMVPIPTDAVSDEDEKQVNRTLRVADENAFDDLTDMQEAANLPL